MRRSFSFFLLVLVGLVTGIHLIPSVVRAGEPERFVVPQWTPSEMIVKPGTCKAQYDGVIVTQKFGEGEPPDGLVVFGDTAYIERTYAEHLIREKLCSQYNRNKGWERPDDCDGVKDSQSGKPHYFCYCQIELIIECTPRDVANETGELLATRGEMRMVAELGDIVASALLNAEKLQHPNFSGIRRSGTRYVSSSRSADGFYEKGMRAYAKPSHTNDETQEALASFEACIEKDPNHAPCLWELGWVHYVNQNYNATDILWRWVKQIDPNHEDVAEQLERLQSKL